MKSAGLSKSERIAAALERDIRSGLLSHGQRLQSEQQLTNRFAASRGTVRKGLEGLTSRGLIATRGGIGSFVTFNGKQIDSAFGWARSLAKTGAETEAKIRRLETYDDPDLAARLGLRKTAFIAIDRTRHLKAGGRAISYERSRLPLTAELADLPLRGLREESLQSTLAAAGLYPDSGEEWAELAFLGNEEAAVFGADAGAPYLQLRRLTRMADKRALEFVTSLLDPALFALHLKF
jgi:GntR family transcriptional regulator